MYFIIMFRIFSIADCECRLTHSKRVWSERECATIDSVDFSTYCPIVPVLAMLLLVYDVSMLTFSSVLLSISVAQR